MALSEFFLGEYAARTQQNAEAIAATEGYIVNVLYALCVVCGPIGDDATHDDHHHRRDTNWIV